MAALIVRAKRFSFSRNNVLIARKQVPAANVDQGEAA